MSDGTEPAALAPDETPAIPAEVEAPVEPVEGDPPLIEDDSEEIDFDGEKYKVPKKLKDSFLMHGDYTRKTQELARLRETTEARAAEIARDAEVRQGLEKDVGRLALIDEQLEAYQKVDWSAWRGANPD